MFISQFRNIYRRGSTQPLDETLCAELDARVRGFIALANATYDTCLAVPSWDARLRGALAGKAHLQRGHLQFNASLLRANQEHFLLQTVGHEVAHLVVWARYRGRVKPHGAEWKAVMRDFGLETCATHDYDVSMLRRTRSPFVYRCACPGDLYLGRVRHQRVARGVTYFCRRCRTPIAFSHQCA
ncbi:MAG: SprT-like domain-containing protein [Gammaproteobacteria bacterium]|nr:SprT-like domain-containing protein [Gammaproteobacteria bacterium]